MLAYETFFLIYIKKNSVANHQSILTMEFRCQNEGISINIRTKHAYLKMQKSK